MSDDHGGSVGHDGEPVDKTGVAFLYDQREEESSI